MTTATVNDTVFELSEHISDRLGISPDDSYKLAEELIEHGIETDDQFDESFQGEFDDWKNEEEFAQEFYLSMGALDTESPLFSYIDWQQVWDSELRYDYFHIDTYFFRNM